MKTALITGSNKGIGFEIARQLCKKGLRVFISGRDENRLSDAQSKLNSENLSAEVLLMDVSELKSIMNASEVFLKYKTRLDVLVNNAAIIVPHDENLLTDSVDLLNKTIQTNCFGPLNVIKEFLSSLNRPSRIVNLSSGGGSMTDPVGGWSPAYCISKTMLNGLTRHLAYELSEYGISVNAVCPGWVKTDMGGKSAPVSVQKGAETPVWLATEAPSDMTGKFFRNKHEIDW